VFFQRHRVREDVEMMVGHGAELRLPGETRVVERAHGDGEEGERPSKDGWFDSRYRESSQHRKRRQKGEDVALAALVGKESEKRVAAHDEDQEEKARPRPAPGEEKRRGERRGRKPPHTLGHENPRVIPGMAARSKGKRAFAESEEADVLGNRREVR
jgi:hypothetical protein